MRLQKFIVILKIKQNNFVIIKSHNNIIIFNVVMQLLLRIFTTDR